MSVHYYCYHVYLQFVSKERLKADAFDEVHQKDKSYHGIMLNDNDVKA